MEFILKIDVAQLALNTKTLKESIKESINKQTQDIEKKVIIEVLKIVKKKK